MKKAVFNRETLKIELHFDKADYLMLSEADKARVKSAFLWSRGGSCWVSRAKEPNLYTAKKIAADLGFGEVEKIGERLTFAEQVERQQERAEARAERYEEHAENAEARAEKLQAGIESHRGDVAFFTQPNINTSAGRSFTNYRNRLYARYDKGFEEYRKSEYWKERAKIAATTAAGEKYKDRAYLDRRIKESKKKLRDFEKTMQAYTNIYEKLSNGETVKKGYYGADVWTFAELEERAGDLAERFEAEADKLAFLEDALDALGGIQYSAENIKPGYIVQLDEWSDMWLYEVVSTGPVNFQARTVGGNFPCPITYAYAQIKKVVKAVEKAPQAQPFKVGEEYTIKRWVNHDYVDATFKIIRATDKSVTIQFGSEKPIVRKPSESKFTPGEWVLAVTDSWNGTVRKKA